MRRIRKVFEPDVLTTWRANHPDDYENFPTSSREVVRESLYHEQLGICCYCTQTLGDPVSTKIEHWHPQSNKAFANERVVYANLLGCCSGNAGLRKSRTHCDEHKADDLLSRNPADPSRDIEAIISYDSKGCIHSTDAFFDAELKTVLNLNVESLVVRRSQALRGLVEAVLIKRRKGSLTRKVWDRWIERYADPQSGRVHDFAPMLVYWLRNHRP